MNHTLQQISQEPTRQTSQSAVNAAGVIVGEPSTNIPVAVSPYFPFTGGLRVFIAEIIPRINDRFWAIFEWETYAKPTLVLKHIIRQGFDNVWKPPQAILEQNGVIIRKDISKCVIPSMLSTNRCGRRCKHQNQCFVGVH